MNFFHERLDKTLLSVSLNLTYYISVYTQNKLVRGHKHKEYHPNLLIKVIILMEKAIQLFEFSLPKSWNN